MSANPAEESKTASSQKTEPNTTRLISELQSRRNSKIISYVVSTRQGLNFQIADDAVRIIYDHLVALDVGKEDKLDLFLHSFGGVGVVPWKLVNLIREFTDHFEVLVPYKAYSAATLIALGADKIVMHPMAELGPIDPKVGNEFNPVTPQGQQVGINVEDVASYIAFVKDFVEIRHEDELIQALSSLTNNVHPLALGNVHRFYAQSRMMARKLLKLHMPDPKDEHVIEEIAEILTSKLFFHGHPINRKEAASLKLKIEEPPQYVEERMWSLYKDYETEMKLREPFNAQEILNSSGGNTIDSLEVIGAFVESKGRRDRYISRFKITRPPIPPNASISVQIQAAIGAIVIPLGSEWRIEFSDPSWHLE
jgi:hypothetical protein